MKRDARPLFLPLPELCKAPPPNMRTTKKTLLIQGLLALAPLLAAPPPAAASPQFALPGLVSPQQRRCAAAPAAAVLSLAAPLSATSCSGTNSSTASKDSEDENEEAGDGGEDGEPRSASPRSFAATTTTSAHQQSRPTTAALAAQLCAALPAQLFAPSGSQLTFKEAPVATWYEDGSNPSLELLASTYPDGWIPPGTDVASILDGVGPDIDITRDYGYGRQGQTHESRLIAANGPLGGLPGFCRVAARIITSPLTSVLTEVWLPIADSTAYPKSHNTGPSPHQNPPQPLAPVNASDYPTASTPIVIDVPTTRDAGHLKSDWQQEYGQGAVYDQSKAQEKFFYAKGPSYVLASNANRLGDPQEVSATSGMARARRDEVLQHSDNGNDLQTRAGRGDKVLTGAQVYGNGISTAWNGRLLFIANGGQRGFVPYPDLKQNLNRHRFVVVGSNSGHFSTTGGVSWVNGSQYADTILDWASRATHVSKILGEEAIDAFYGSDAGVRVKRTSSAVTAATASNKHDGKQPKDSAQVKQHHKGMGKRVRAYFAGCSVGGKAGLSSVQVYPDDFDGVLVGSPANYFNRLNAGQIHTQRSGRPQVAMGGYFRIGKYWSAIHATVLKQCDHLDGVRDGVIADAERCNVDFAKDLLCGSTANDSLYANDTKHCLNSTQIETLNELYRPTVLEGTKVYERYLPGLERSPATLTGAAAKSIDWFELAILQKPTLDPNFDGYNNITLADVQLGERENPGGSNGDNTDISAFLANPRRKLLHTHGSADLTVSPLMSTKYYKDVQRNSRLPRGRKLSDSYRLFMIPGMGHCRDGDGPWHFGHVTQNDAGNRPLQFDTRHDILLALVAWTEQELVPAYQVGAAYGLLGGVTPADPDNPPTKTVSDVPTWFSSYEYGVRFTRKLCPYPQKARHLHGPTTGIKSYQHFSCE
ncbi:tannase-domain-containing protein [Tilletiaria anomala UBC 951]|uniref:Carboxylic ester hydrolase n=1 Tax=Tilletiaria anomala (strain ATCC 24038 / CBS 436.72 / UBC 951) TaxID=1037660 RepID=A0A066W162_TILAU|nr:tannase-domain-containing protein [Tilletiaria anomala UBC 951]KDN44530.1 tannase-domain-containing protein [Tilletiaria anomala UBC 951]